MRTTDGFEVKDDLTFEEQAMPSTRQVLPAGTVLHFNGVALKTAVDTEFEIDSLNLDAVTKQIQMVRLGLESGLPAVNENAELRVLVAKQGAMLERVADALEAKTGGNFSANTANTAESGGGPRTGNQPEDAYPFPENFMKLSKAQKTKWYKDNGVNEGWAPDMLPDNFAAMSEADRWTALSAENPAAKT